jgi:hypothetical protein
MKLETMCVWVVEGELAVVVVLAAVMAALELMAVA